VPSHSPAAQRIAADRLKRNDIDFAIKPLLSPANPSGAEPAIAIVNQQRPFRRRRTSAQSVQAINRRSVHAFK
jgi:hypothetical protein